VCQKVTGTGFSLSVQVYKAASTAAVAFPTASTLGRYPGLKCFRTWQESTRSQASYSQQL